MGRYISESYPLNGVITKRKKKKWVAETSYISAEGDTEIESIAELAKKLRIIASDLEEIVEKYDELKSSVG